jgi:hypothetical protein
MTRYKLKGIYPDSERNMCLWQQRACFLSDVVVEKYGRDHV